MDYALDLTRYAFRHQRGDLTLYGTWFGKDNPRPCLVLTATYRRTVPCVVLLENAWLWSDEVGDPGHCARSSVNFAQYLGLDYTNQITCMRVTSLIQDHLGDLIAMPPKPNERIVVADAILTDEHGKERHAEVTRRV